MHYFYFTDSHVFVALTMSADPLQVNELITKLTMNSEYLYNKVINRAFNTIVLDQTSTFSGHRIYTCVCEFDEINENIKSLVTVIANCNNYLQFFES